MNRPQQRSAIRAAQAALLCLALGTGGAHAETASVIDPTEGLEAPKAPAVSPQKAAPTDGAIRRERQRVEAEQRRRARAEARAQAAERESERLRAQEQARLAEAAARENAARAAAAKKAAAAKAAARLAAQRQAAAREAAALEAVAKQVAAREAAARESAARELAMREAAERERTAREAAAREVAAKENAARERAAKEIAAKEAAAKEAAVREATARIAAAREAADRLIGVRQAGARESTPKMLAGFEAIGRELGMLKNTPQFGTVFRDCAGCPEMVWLPQGDFVLGDAALDAGRPRVAIRYALAVGRFELSFSEWDACASAGGCRRRPSDGGWGRGWQPVVNVSWLDAQQYVAWLSRRTNRRYRLLTEAEWEYAARAGTDARYWWGDQPGRGEANCADCGSKWDGRQAAPIGRFAPNPFGLYDMHGNVAEWVEDCYHDRLRDAPVDGRAWTSGCNISAESRVVRGGAWYGTARSMRSSYRTSAAVDHLDNGIGFRVARTD
jgi:formylglycine-generating enzyme required for sulfatase activity